MTNTKKSELAQAVKRPHVTDAPAIGEAFRVLVALETSAVKSVAELEAQWTKVGTMLIEVRDREKGRFSEWLTANEGTLGFARSKAYTMIRFTESVKSFGVAVFKYHHDNANMGRNGAIHGNTAQIERAVGYYGGGSISQMNGGVATTMPSMRSDPKDVGVDATRRAAAERARKSRERKAAELGRLRVAAIPLKPEPPPPPTQRPPLLSTGNVIQFRAPDGTINTAASGLERAWLHASEQERHAFVDKYRDELGALLSNSAAQEAS